MKVFTNKTISINGVDLQRFPKEFLTQEICEFAVMRCIDNFIYVPDEFITEKMCMLVVSRYNTKYAEMYSHIPKRFLNDDVIISMMDTNFSSAIECIVNNDIELSTEVIAVIMSKYMGYFPVYVYNHDDAGTYSCKKSYKFRHIVPDEWFTDDKCNMLINRYGAIAYTWLPNRCITEERLIDAIENKIPISLLDISIDQITASEKVKDAIYNMMAHFVNINDVVSLKDHIPADTWYTILHKNMSLIRHMPDDYKTVDICYNALLQGYDVNIPENTMRDKLIWETLLIQDIGNYSILPEDLKDSQEVKDFVQEIIDGCLPIIKRAINGQAHP